MTPLMWLIVILATLLMLFVAFCMRQRLHRHKFDRTLDAMIETQRFRGAKAANDFSVGIERALKAVGQEPQFKPPTLGSAATQLLESREPKKPPDEAGGVPAR